MFRTMFRQALWRVIKQQKLLSPSLIIYEEDSMDQGSGESESGGDDVSEQGSPLNQLVIPFVEDMNLSHAQYLGVLSELHIKLEDLDQILIDKMFQILTCNQSKLLRSSNLFNFVLAIQDGICHFEDMQRPDLNIEEECDFGGFTSQGRFVFFTQRQFDLVKQEFRGF